ncbi:uncharacterized protein LOC133334564 [Musca vetustissima]|uniref:uncharacterized protein LOC133334564 n=1 Tax=Musca vetustissima TaxID=27455 RepID=UPI002AB6261C|nr:uncharacterized protein LOC133334564 [Musca vetustissima]
MFHNILKSRLIAILAGLLIISRNLATIKAEEEIAAVENVAPLTPELLSLDIQGHENTSGRKVRQFGYYPPPPPPPPFGFPPPAFGRPPPPPPPYFGYGGGFGRTRVITRTRTRYVNRYGGFGGFYG